MLFISPDPNLSFSLSLFVSNEGRFVGGWRWRGTGGRGALGSAVSFLSKESHWLLMKQRTLHFVRTQCYAKIMLQATESTLFTQKDNTPSPNLSFFISRFWGGCRWKGKGGRGAFGSISFFALGKNIQFKCGVTMKTKEKLVLVVILGHLVNWKL